MESYDKGVSNGGAFMRNGQESTKFARIVAMFLTLKTLPHYGVSSVTGSHERHGKTIQYTIWDKIYIIRKL